MKFLENLILKLTNRIYDIGTEHWVDVTHINDPHSFYVRPTLCRRYLSILHRYDKKPKLSELKQGAVMIYKSHALQCNVRGRVMFIDDDDEDGIFVDMFAMDFGRYDRSVPLGLIRKPLRSANVPPLAIHCELADCKPRLGNWCPTVIDSMKSLIGKKRAKLVIRDKTPGSLIVELFNSCPDHDIATMLAFDGHTTFGYSENMLNNCNKKARAPNFYTFKEFEVGDTITVRFQYGKSLNSFYVAQMHDYRHYLRERAEFSHCCRMEVEMKNDSIDIGRAVAVFSYETNLYERALVLEMCELKHKITVILVDWGRTLEVSVCRLKPMADKFFNSPGRAIYCMAEDSQVADPALRKFLYPGYKFNITIVDVGNGLDSPNLVKISPLLRK